jgi:hypothetical protein
MRLAARISILTRIAAFDTGRWLPSLLVRRLERLELSVA